MEFQNFDVVIEDFKEPYKLNKYNKRNDIVIEKFIKELKKQKDILIDILKQENEKWNYNFNINRFFQIADKYEHIEYNNNQKFGIGNIIAIQAENPYLNLELIFNTILANCRVMIITGEAFISFNMYIISLIQKVLKNENLDLNLISFVDALDYKKRIIDNKQVIDCIIVNREYDDYYFFQKNTSIKTIYLDYGNINIYTDGDEYKNQIDIVSLEADKLDMDVYSYEIDDLDIFLKKENNNFVFNTAVIYSKDIKKCMKLYEIIKARNVFINTFDINKIDIGLDINDLLFEKKIIIEDGK